MALPAAYSSHPVVVGSMALCLRGAPTPAVITGITPYQGNGHLFVASFATRAAPDGHYAPDVIQSLKSFTALGYDPSSHAVSEPCPTTKNRLTGKWGYDQLAIRYRRLGNVTGSDNGAMVDYTVDSQSKHMVAVLGVTLCGSNDHAGRCG